MELVLVLLFFGIVLFIGFKINRLKDRAREHILKDTPLSTSNINAGINNAFEKKFMENFLSENPNFTEESIKDLLRQYAFNLINKKATSDFTEEVCNKMQGDTKLDNMANMQYRRANIAYYGRGKMTAFVVFTDNRDEYVITLNFSVINNGFQLDRYQISKGAMVGF